MAISEREKVALIPAADTVMNGSNKEQSRTKKDEIATIAILNGTT